MQNMEIRTIIIDSNYIGNVAKYSSGELTWNGKPTGVIFGFLRSILGMAKHFQPARFVFVWDTDPRLSLRKKAYPPYKEHRHSRERTRDEIKIDGWAQKQYQELMEYTLPKFGFRNIFWQAGYEADDIIAALVRGPLKGAIVATNDDDLLQLTDVCSLYNPVNRVTKTRDFLLVEYKVSPKEWPKIKSIAGCTSDGVEGIRGVGEKTAAKWLLGGLKASSIAARKIDSVYGDIVSRRNLPLVTLPWPGTMCPKIVREGFYMDDFFDLCDEYGFITFMRRPMVDNWKHLFGMVET